MRKDDLLATLQDNFSNITVRKDTERSHKMKDEILPDEKAVLTFELLYFEISISSYQSLRNTNTGISIYSNFYYLLCVDEIREPLRNQHPINIMK